MEQGVSTPVGGVATAAPRRMTAATMLFATAAVLTLGAAGFAVRWFTVTPAMLSPCRGVLDPEDRDRPVPFTVAKSLDGQEEYRVPVAREGRVALFLCPASTTPIEVLDVRLPIRPEQYSPVRPDTPHAVDLDRGGSEPADAPPLQPYQLGPDRPERQVALLFRFDDCERFVTGSSLGFDRYEVDYRYRGRERTASIPFGVRYSFVSPADVECPERANIPPPTGPPALETDVTKNPPT